MEESGAVEKIEEVDHLRLQLANSETRRLRAELECALVAQRNVEYVFRAKYKLDANDGYDGKTLEIKRAAKRPKQ